MKEKYIDEVLGVPIYIFGESEDKSMVDIANSSGDIVTGVKRNEAENAICLVDNVMKLIYYINAKYPDILNESLIKSGCEDRRQF